jgi:hypothetical protein
MALQLPSLPNYNVTPPQVPSPLEQYGKMLQLKMLSGQAAMQPLQQQEAEQDIQAKTLENQQREIALKTQQAQNTYWSNPSQFTAAAPAGGDILAKTLGVADDDPILGMVRGQMKAGVPGNAAIADAKATLEFRRSVAQSTQEQQKVLDDSHSKLQQLAAPILAEKDPEKKAALIEQARPGFAEWASFDPSIKPIIPQLNAQNFDAFANRLGAEQGALDLRAKSADLWKKELENKESVDPLLKMQNNPGEAFAGDKLPASLAYLETKVTDPDPKVKTLATNLLGQARVAKAIGMEKEQYIQNQENLRQQHNREAMQANELQKAGLSSLDKMFTDPQHGYSQFLAQANSTKTALSEAKDGNELAASLAPLMTVLGVNSFAGIHRVNPQEIAAAGPGVGSLYRQVNTVLDKAVAGKMNEDTRKEMDSVIDGLISAKHASLIPSAQLVTRNAGLDPSKTSVLDKDGSVTTLDKVGQPKQPANPTAPGAFSWDNMPKH